ncbi:MAG: amidohydrolase family protein [Candidatus Eisenbacteria bacterium]
MSDEKPGHGRSGGTVLIKGGTVLTMNASRAVIRGDVLIRDGKIASVGGSDVAGGACGAGGVGGGGRGEGRAGDPERANGARRGDNAGGPGETGGTGSGSVDCAGHGGVVKVLDAGGCFVLPGFVQTHVHLCQTLFRGVVESVGLGNWLERIWKLEAAHDEDSMYCSAMLGCCELLRSGTTCILDMGSVHHTGQVFRALSESGLRGFGGKAMMDFGEGVPAGLMESTQQSLAESLSLHSRWHGSEGDRIRYAFAPRFLESCSPELLRAVTEKARQLGLLIHSHASETRDELESCKRTHGESPIAFLDSIGMSGTNVVLAHCVHLEPEDFDVLRDTRTVVSHCPSSNLKLSSGIADVGRMVRSGVRISLGCDGAPCNNNLDMFIEMRLAALLQRYLNRDELPWHDVFLEAATRGGAEALGLGDVLGSIEPGRRADIVVADVSQAHSFAGDIGTGGGGRGGTGRRDAVAGDAVNPSARVVFSSKGADVKDVIVDGRVVVQDGRLTAIDEKEIVARSREELKKLLSRAGGI